MTWLKGKASADKPSQSAVERPYVSRRELWSVAFRRAVRELQEELAR